VAGHDALPACIQGWREAAACYEALADVNTKLDSKHDAATSYVEAAKCAMKFDAVQGVALLKRAVDMYTDVSSEGGGGLSLPALTIDWQSIV